MHPVAWFVWLAGAAAASLLSRNPLYLVVVFGIAYVVAESARSSESQSVGVLPISPLRFAAFAIVAGAVFNGLTSHAGETVLFSFPRAIPLLGGPVTVEGLAYGALNGLVLATLYATFAVLNAAVPVRDLIGYLPRAFYPAAIVSAIAVTFVPNTLRQFQQVREAQAVRGHRMRGLRDWLPLFMPVLIGGLERALQLAETMTARGFATPSVAPSGPSESSMTTRCDGKNGPRASRPQAHEQVSPKKPRPAHLSLARERARSRRSSGTGSLRSSDRPLISAFLAYIPQIALVAGLGCVLAASVLRLVPGGSLASSLTLVIGVVLTIVAVWRSGSGVHTTRYRQPSWTWRDSLVVAGSIAAATSFLLWPAARDYSPYPLLIVPALDLRVVVALLGLLVPTLVTDSKSL